MSSDCPPDQETPSQGRVPRSPFEASSSFKRKTPQFCAIVFPHEFEILQGEMNFTRHLPPSTVLSSAKPKPWLCRTLLFALILSFGVMSSFAPFLHSHEWTQEQTEKNCSPCQWTHSGIGVESKAPGFSTTALAIFHTFKLKIFIFQKLFISYPGRSPPLFS